MLNYTNIGTLLFFLDHTRDRAIARAVSRWLPTAATRVRFQVKSLGTCGGTGAGLLRVLRFPLPVLTPSTAVYSLLILLLTPYILHTDGVVK
jgi:hypothetical protein